MDNWNALFDLSARYGLDITDSPLRPDVLNFRGREALSEPFCWTIEFTAPPGDIAPEQVLMKYASLRMRTGREVHGVLTGLERISTNAEQSHWRVTLESRLALLSRTRQCAVFQNQSVPEVVEQVLRRHDFTGPDFDFRLERTYPPREVITQWRESDLEFIQRLLSEVGIWFRSEMQATTESEMLIFADSQSGYQFDVRLPYSEPTGLFDGAAESVWDVRTRNQVVTGGTATRDYNYRTASTPQDSTVSVRSDAVTTGGHYRYAAPFREAGDDGDPEPATESGAFYARIHHERELNKSAWVHLFSNASSLAPGQVLEPQGEVIKALREGVIITLVTFSATRDSRLHVSVTILEIHDCRPQEQQWVDQVVNVTLKAWKTSGAKYWPLFLYPPIFMPRPPATPVAAKVEPWTYAGNAVADLSEGAIRGVAEGWNALSKETREVLKYTAGWLNDSGEWVYQQGKERWVWFSRTGRYVCEWSNEQIRAAWAAVQQASDMTLEMLKQVDWVQVLTDVGKTIGVIVVVVGVAAAVFYLGIPAAIIELFLFIVRLAITAWDKLALILGSGAAAGSLAY